MFRLLCHTKEHCAHNEIKMLFVDIPFKNPFFFQLKFAS